MNGFRAYPEARYALCYLSLAYVGFNTWLSSNRFDIAAALPVAPRAALLAGAFPVGDVRRDEFHPGDGGALRAEHPLHEGLDRQAAQLVR